MNNISWFIYLAEILARFGIATLLLGIGLLIFSAVCFFASFEESESVKEARRKGQPVPEDKVGQEMRKASLVLLIASALSFLFAIIIPSSTTMYMIAASEIGEQVVTTPQAVEVLEALKAKILNELKVN